MATKKIKAVETPIDQRETFVSLQKSFADSEVSVEEKLKTLFNLQQTDIEIDKIVHLRGELPSEVEALEQEIASLKGKSENIESLIEGYNDSIEAHKKNIVEIDAEITKYQKQLENITNSREYDSINKELENQGLLRQISEKTINECKIAIAEKKDNLEELGKRIEVREEDLKVKKEELANIIESNSSEEEKLMAKRNKLVASIDARTMSAYERIRSSVHNHLAVVSLYNGSEDEDAPFACGGCFNTITPQRLVDIASNKKLIICEHCGRIIVNPKFD